ADRGRRKGERLGVAIEATVHVEKEAQKKIVVGEGGRVIRDVGTAARAEISRLLSCPVHLGLFVRVDEGWTGSRHGMREMGYDASGEPTPVLRRPRGRQGQQGG